MVFKYYTRRKKIPKTLEKLLDSVKGFHGGYESENDYLKLLENLKNTNPFSVLVFYENPSEKPLNKNEKKKRKKLNPSIPERMLSAMARYVQFYFIPELKEKHFGASIGSGYRHVQSLYAVALSQFHKDVPTHILIMDKENKVKHILSSPVLIVQPHETIQSVPAELARELLKDTIKAYCFLDNHWEKIERISINYP
ncbi:MAG: hypothetical protein U9Q69_01005 [Nanoarchaeota archaeon]|nr:hypothetical protein [Nanoarchaeota archaeon]